MYYENNEYNECYIGMIYMKVDDVKSGKIAKKTFNFRFVIIGTGEK